MITEDVKKLLSNSLGMESRGAGHTELVNRLNSLEAKIALLVDAASAGDSFAPSGALVPATVVDGPASSDTSCRTFIVNDRTRKVHELWIDDVSVDFARARCGWKYETCAQTISSSFVEVAWFDVCDKCMHSGRAALEAKQAGEETGSESE